MLNTFSLDGWLRAGCTVKIPYILVLVVELATLLTWWFWPSWVLYSRLKLLEEMVGLSSSILLLFCLTLIWYSFPLLLNKSEEDLGLCILISKEWPLTSSKLLSKLNMASIKLVSMLMSCPDVSFKKLKLIVVVECVIFPWSLIGTTIQDGSKRERSNYITSYFFI